MNTPAHRPTADRAWLAEVIERARDQVRPSGIFAPGQEYAQALVMLADERDRQPTREPVMQTVFSVISVEDREVVSVWRSCEEAEDERGRLAREHGRWLFYVQSNALKGAR